MFATSSAPARDPRAEPPRRAAAGLAEARGGDHGHRDRRRALERDGGRGEAAIAAVMAEMHRIDRTMSPHKDDSELTRINRGAGAGRCA
jgi:thiamine biosynthesis lipoprotein